MSQDNVYLYDVIKQIEDFIYFGFPIFGSYYLIYRSELYNKFKLLYDSLPKDLIDNKDLLNSQKEENIFSLLNEISFMLEQSKTFLGFMLVNINNITSILDKMYASLPVDIMICRGDDNTDSISNIEIVEIPKFLRK